MSEGIDLRMSHPDQCCPGGYCFEGLEIHALDYGAARRIELGIFEAKAQAWDEGFVAGEQDVMEHESRGWPDDDPCIPNPYREETK